MPHYKPAEAGTRKQIAILLAIRRIVAISRHHRAPPRLLSVTESVVLPPQPKGRSHGAQNSPHSISAKLAGTPGIDALIFLRHPAGRCCDGHSMVISVARLPQDGLSPTRHSQSSLAHYLDARAAAALNGAQEMPPGDERTEAINKATVFRNAARIHELLCGKRDAPEV